MNGKCALAGLSDGRYVVVISGGSVLSVAGVQPGSVIIHPAGVADMIAAGAFSADELGVIADALASYSAFGQSRA